jgi:hypothetical protein
MYLRDRQVEIAAIGVGPSGQRQRRSRPLRLGRDAPQSFERLSALAKFQQLAALAKCGLISLGMTLIEDSLIM